MSYVKLVGHKNPQNWTTEIVLERDENGEVTSSVKAGVPVDLNASDKSDLEDKGFIFESSSKSEADEVAASPVVGTDTATSGPVFDTDTIDQPEDSEESSGKKK